MLKHIRPRFWNIYRRSKIPDVPKRGGRELAPFASGTHTAEAQSTQRKIYVLFFFRTFFRTLCLGVGSESSEFFGCSLAALG